MPNIPTYLLRVLAGVYKRCQQIATQSKVGLIFQQPHVLYRGNISRSNLVSNHSCIKKRGDKSNFTSFPVLRQ